MKTSEKNVILNALNDPLFSNSILSGSYTLTELLKINFSKYLKIISGLAGKDNRIDKNWVKKQKELCRNIELSLKYSLMGLPFNAFQFFSNGIKLIEDSIYHKEIIDYLIYDPKTKKTLIRETLYRARKYSMDFPLEKKELFHIPFEERYKVATQRFSIPGLPCLYFSNTPLLCWFELGQPNINNLTFSRLDIDSNEFKMVDLTMNNIHAVDAVNLQLTYPDLELDYYISYLKRWPLIYSSLIPTIKYDTYKNVAFKEEYIIPQLLLEWVRYNKNADGVIYPSTKNIQYKNPNGENYNPAFYNYVIPAKNVTDKEYCSKLLKYAKLTDPILVKSESFFNKFSYSNKYPHFDLQDFNKYVSYSMSGPDKMMTVVNIKNGCKTYYYKSIFMEIEDKLIREKASCIS